MSYTISKYNSRSNCTLCFVSWCINHVSFTAAWFFKKNYEFTLHTPAAVNNIHSTHNIYVLIHI